MSPTVFADTFYWLALAQPRDAWHPHALQWAVANPSTRIVTTDEVLTEFLNALAGTGPAGRAHAAATAHDIRTDPQVVVLPQTRTDFDAALALYEARADQEYSLTDCRSRNAMHDHSLTEVLTHDRHYIQEGFTVLFP
jgi:predicted nucleic acid-binding protein